LGPEWRNGASARRKRESIGLLLGLCEVAVRSALSCHGYPLASIATAQALNPGSIEENETMPFHYERLLFDPATVDRLPVAF
jgi:hypothetical protein